MVNFFLNQERHLRKLKVSALKALSFKGVNLEVSPSTTLRVTVGSYLRV